MKKYIVDKKNILYNYLRDNLNESKNSIKSMLTKKYIRVNNKIITKYDYEVKEKDVIEIGCNYIETEYYTIKIIYEDKDIIVVDKPNKLLSIDDGKNSNTLYHIVSTYVKGQNKKSKIFVVHRLDKDTSGIILFAKNEKTKAYYQNNWNNITKRYYKAIVNGKTKDEGTIKLKLLTQKLQTIISKEGKETITKYKKIKENDKYTLLDIEILTGKKNQIRIGLSHIGNPIVGDSKYGAKSMEKNLCLHAYKLEIKDENGKNRIFTSNTPNYFKKYI